MRGTMMEFPLTLTAILERAGSSFTASKSFREGPICPSCGRIMGISTGERGGSRTR